MEPDMYCVNIPSSDLPLHIPVEWLVRGLVLCSMLLQVFLVFGGGYRYRSSNAVLRFVVWLAYMSADVVAISALSIMTYSVQTQIYGVWAPLLLLHLGGPDTITAYSTPDNELWIRHGLIMIYQVSVAGYVMSLSSLQGNILASAILLFIAGATKYGERTLALSYASYGQIVRSTEPVYKFMQYEDEMDKESKRVDYNYLVMGEEQFQQNLKEKQQENAKQRNETRNSSSEDRGLTSRYNSWNSLLKGGEIVTIKNVWHQEGLQTTNNYILCLSHALFKMYKRRFVGLYFHEGVRPKTRKFFINERLSCQDLFKIVEMELKFMYDILFSKSSGTAFSKMGTLMRLLNTCLLGVAGMLLYIGANAKPAQKIVTYILISVALSVEIIQLYRIAVSDWTMVRLICAYIQHLRRPSRYCWFMFKLVRLSLCLLGNIRKITGSKYWKESLTQYSVIDTCSSRWSFMWHWSQHFRMFGDLFVPLFINAFHIKEKPVKDADDFKRFVFEKLKATCSLDQEVSTCRERVYGYDEYLVTMGCEDLQWASELDMEDLILTWHMATTICERAPPVTSTAAASPVSDAAGAPDRNGVNGDAVSAVVSESAAGAPMVKENIRFCRLLSRYCAYLLVSHPNLLPLHPDIAKMTYIDLHYELVPLLKKGQQEWKWMEYQSNNTTLGFGTRLARELLKRPQKDMWEILSGYWAGLLIYMAVYNKAPLHAECLAYGGEFFSQVWALLGHMGCGEQSDTAVTKKKEEKSKKEKEEEEKKRKREEETSKEFEKNRTREEGKNARKRERLRARKEAERNMRREEDKKQKVSERRKEML